MIRPAWVDVTLFSLSQRPVCMSAISTIVILAWWNLADYYMVQRFPHWPEAMEPFIVFGLSVFWSPSLS